MLVATCATIGIMLANLPSAVQEHTHTYYNRDKGILQ